LFFRRPRIRRGIFEMKTLTKWQVILKLIFAPEKFWIYAGADNYEKFIERIEKMRNYAILPPAGRQVCTKLDVFPGNIRPPEDKP